MISPDSQEKNETEYGSHLEAIEKMLLAGKSDIDIKNYINTIKLPTKHLQKISRRNKLDTTLSGNLKSLGMLSFAAGYPGVFFVANYYFSCFFHGVTSQVAIYMLKIGAGFIVFSLLSAPAAYKKILPDLNYELTNRVSRVTSAGADFPLVRRIFNFIDIGLLKINRLIFLCSHPLFIFALVAACLAL